MKTSIHIDNLKCNGCAASIRKGLEGLEDVSHIHVDLEQALVEVEHTQADTLEKVKAKLHSMGYPEAGSLHGLDKYVTQTKSYVSCAIGKLSNTD